MFGAAENSLVKEDVDNSQDGDKALIPASSRVIAEVKPLEGDGSQCRTFIIVDNVPIVPNLAKSVKSIAKPVLPRFIVQAKAPIVTQSLNNHVLPTGSAVGRTRNSSAVLSAIIRDSVFPAAPNTANMTVTTTQEPASPQTTGLFGTSPNVIITATKAVEKKLTNVSSAETVAVVEPDSIADTQPTYIIEPTITKIDPKPKPLKASKRKSVSGPTAELPAKLAKVDCGQRALDPVPPLMYIIPPQVAKMFMKPSTSSNPHSTIPVFPGDDHVKKFEDLSRAHNLLKYNYDCKEKECRATTNKLNSVKKRLETVSQKLSEVKSKPSSAQVIAKLKRDRTQERSIHRRFKMVHDAVCRVFSEEQIGRLVERLDDNGEGDEDEGLWDPEDYVKAAGLYLISESAYAYVKEDLGVPLPGQMQLQQWITSEYCGEETVEQPN